MVIELIIRRYFRDLDIYYAKMCLDRGKAVRPAKDVLREELARILRKYRRKDIVLIGHSMGSIDHGIYFFGKRDIIHLFCGKRLGIKGM